MALSLFPLPGAAQQPGLSGDYLNVGTHVQESVLGPAGTSDVQRLRVMWNASPGPLRLDAAYEQTLTLRQGQGGRGSRQGIVQVELGLHDLPSLPLGRGCLRRARIAGESP
ncbi:MAG: hypothetical protein OXQ90_00525 [Gammaproteobacteria bacterium]|nr:hypothetical protein [Gammaproteobacteria bacterium]